MSSISDFWEKQPNGLLRTDVPGGWLYSSEHALILTFVPFPPAVSERQKELEE